MTGDQDMTKVPLHPSGAGKALRGYLSLGFPGFTGWQGTKDAESFFSHSESIWCCYMSLVAPSQLDTGLAILQNTFVAPLR